MDEFINLAKTYTGFDDLDEDWLSQVWLGANGELNIAINHVLDGRIQRRTAAAPPARPPAPAPGAAPAVRRVRPRVERFDRRGTEPFELFRSEFGQNPFKVQEFSLEN